jgi:anti-sigma factor RsiW
MSDPIYDELIRLSLKRELTDDDRARIETSLAAHPELREQWEADFALGRLVNRPLDVRLSSNFTARVLEQLDLDERATVRTSRSRWREWLRRIEPRLGLGFACAAALAFGAHQYRVLQTARAHDQIERVQLARELRVVSQEIASLPSPELFTDFNAINQLRQVSSVSDDELLKVLQ